jgi:hypothetical protein
MFGRRERAELILVLYKGARMAERFLQQSLRKGHPGQAEEKKME